MMLYAHPGVGKTTFLGTGPERTLILRPPVDHLSSISPENRTGKHEWVLRNWDETWEALEYLRDSNGDGWEWVWFDSISLFQDIGLDDIWAAAVARKSARKEFGLDKGEYGINMFRLAQWIRHIVGAELFHFGVTAHPAEIDNPFDEDGMSGILMPYIQGKNMSAKICGYMNIVAYLRVVKTKQGGEARVLTARASDRWYGKDQFNAIPDGRLVNPTIPKLMSLIEGSSAPPRTRKRRTA